MEMGAKGQFVAGTRGERICATTRWKDGEREREGKREGGRERETERERGRERQRGRRGGTRQVLVVCACVRRMAAHTSRKCADRLENAGKIPGRSVEGLSN